MNDLTESECWSVLRSTDVGRIALSAADQQVDIFPVNFVVDHGTIVFRTGEGTKLAASDHAGKVAFEADGLDEDGHSVWSVVAHGRAERIHRRDDVLDAFELDVRPLIPAGKPFFIRVVPESISGRRFPVSRARIVTSRPTTTTRPHEP